MCFIRPQIGLFVGSDLSSSMLIKHLIPDIQRLGWRVKVYLPENKPLAPTADYRLQTFYQYERRLLSNVQHILDQHPTSFRANCYSYKALSNIFDVQIEPVSDINSELFLAQIAQELDAVLSIRCLQIFRLPFIELFSKKDGFIWNLHSGPLPQCRGAMPIFWTMMNDIPKVTLSLHEITPKIDEGRVIAEKSFEYSTEKSLLEVSCDSVEYAASLITNSFECRKKGDLQPISQSNKHARYYSYPKQHDVELFFSAGKKMLPLAPADYVVSQLSGDEPTLKQALEIAIPLTNKISQTSAFL
jgi:folate-dependent phosphoribosylglycinamide formyltransferase PurN